MPRMTAGLCGARRFRAKTIGRDGQGTLDGLLGIIDRSGLITSSFMWCVNLKELASLGPEEPMSGEEVIDYLNDVILGDMLIMVVGMVSPRELVDLYLQDGYISEETTAYVQKLIPLSHYLGAIIMPLSKEEMTLDEPDPPFDHILPSLDPGVVQ